MEGSEDVWNEVSATRMKESEKANASEGASVYMYAREKLKGIEEKCFSPTLSQIQQGRQIRAR